jgi:RNA polymerase sigma-70 factor (ECF subfamily)
MQRQGVLTVVSSTRTEAAATASALALDEATLDAFVRQHHDRLVGLARLVCLEPTDAADAVQAAFEQAWRHRSRLGDRTSLRPWLDRIVVREAIRIDRRRRSPLARFFGGPREIPPDLVDRRATPDASVTALRIAYERLPADLRAAIALHLYLGYSVAETSSIVGAPIETVRSRLRIGRERIRRDLQEDPS